MKLFIYLMLVISIILLSCGKENKENGTANFSYKKECPRGTPCTVQFINNSTGDAYYTWDFGDNSSFSNEPNPYHEYKEGNTFTVTLTAQYASSRKIYKQTIDISALGGCETKGSFSCAKKLFPMSLAQDIMNSNSNNYYYFELDTPGVIQIVISPVPGLSNDHYFDVQLLPTASSSSSPIISTSGKGGETISFYAGPLAKQEYFLWIKDRYAPDTIHPFTLSYRFINTDMNEPNNSFVTATLLTPYTTISGTILGIGDSDYYTYYQPHPGSVDVQIYPVPDFGKDNTLRVAIYQSSNSNYPSYWRTIYGYSGEILHFPIGPLDSGYHYIVLDANGLYQSPQQYHISAAFDTSDLHEPNGTFFEATPISFNQPIRGTIKSSRVDNDFFKFTATSKKPLTIFIPLVPEGLGTMYIDLYDGPTFDDKTDAVYCRENKPYRYTFPDSLTPGTTYYLSLHGEPMYESNRQYTLIINQ